MDRKAAMKLEAEIAPFEAALEALRNGKTVVVYDEDHAEAGGYLCTGSSRISAEHTNLMASEGRGLICVAIGEERMQTLGIPVVVPNSPHSGRMTFGASVEAATGVTTGISTADRARTIAVVADANAGPERIVMPGHVFPILVHPGGVLINRGIPEAALDLVGLADAGGGAALCAVLNSDGDLADADDLRSLANRLDLPCVDVGTVLAHRLRGELVVERVSKREIESAYGGRFVCIVYRSPLDAHEHIALVAGEPAGQPPPLVRVHSQCLTGDVFRSGRCDCGDQLALALARISEQGRGVLVYMHQEGRGIGLGNKIRAYALQDKGRDTVQANLELGFKDDLRDYRVSAQILKDLGVFKLRLLTNNPRKVEELQRNGIEVCERVPIETSPHEGNIAYLRTKRLKLGHILKTEGFADEGEDKS